MASSWLTSSTWPFAHCSCSLERPAGASRGCMGGVEGPLATETFTRIHRRLEGRCAGPRGRERAQDAEERSARRLEASLARVGAERTVVPTTARGVRGLARHLLRCFSIRINGGGVGRVNREASALIQVTLLRSLAGSLAFYWPALAKKRDGLARNTRFRVRLYNFDCKSVYQIFAAGLSLERGLQKHYRKREFNPINQWVSSLLDH